MSANFDQRPWKRLLDDTLFPVEKRSYPSQVNELVELVREAESRKFAVKACGSHWAPCDAAVNANGYVVESNDDDAPRPSGQFNRTLHNVIGKNGCLTNAAVTFLRNKHSSPFDPTAEIKPVPIESGVDADVATVDRGHTAYSLAHFEAGTKVFEAYSRLDAGLDEPDSLSALIPSLSGSWALRTLGGAGGQTLAGVVSTGVHGGDVHLPPIADSVQAIHLVAANGKQHWIERELAPGVRLTDNAKLRRALGDIDIHRDDDAFNAALVSVGRMGIIYSVVLRVVRPYVLQQVTQEKTWAEAKTMISAWFPVSGDVGSIQYADRFLQIIVNPQRRADDPNTRSCFVTTRKTLSLSKGEHTAAARAQRTGMNAGKTDQFGSPALGTVFCLNADDAGLKKWLDPLVTYVAAPLYRTAKALAQVVSGAALAAAAAALTPPLFVGAPGLIAAGISPTSIIPAITLITDLSVGAELIGADDFTDKFSSIEIVLKIAEFLDIFPDETEKLRGVLQVSKIFKDVLVDRDHKTFGGLISELCNKLVEADRLEYLRAASEALLGALGKPNDMTEISYAVMDNHNYADRGCQTRGVSLEAFLDVHQTLDGGADRAVFRFAENIFGRLESLQNGSLPRTGGQRKAFAGYLALRFMGKTTAMIGMQQSRVTVSFEFAGLGGCTGNVDMMREIEQLAMDSGATLHWGQSNETVDVFAVEREYPQIEKWRDVLSALSENGRLPTFSTPFTRKKGLEVYRPKVGKFFVSPANGVAGEPGSIFWDSRANPPGTLAELIVEQAGQPPVESDLPDLMGIQHIPVPAGITKYTFIVHRDVNVEGTSQSRSFSSQVVQEVRGFTESDPIHRIEVLATTREVDGLTRYAVFMQFFGGIWSTNLRVKRMSVEFSDGERDGFWEVRNDSTITRRLSPSADNVSFSDRPFIAGNWLFVFIRPPFSGPLGAAPTLRLNIRFTSDPLPLP